MQYIITVLLVLMTITFITCGILLWRRRAETGDYSRTIQGCGNSYFCKNATQFCRTATPMISTPPFIRVPLQFNFIKINS